METKIIILPACVGPQSATVTATLTSTGAITPPTGFATLASVNNSLQILMTSQDLSITGQSYQFKLEFIEASADGICQPALINVLVKCTQSVDCSASTQSNLNYQLTQTTTLTIPACVVSPIACSNTSVGTLTPTGAAPPTGFATLTKNMNGSNSFILTMLSSDAAIVGQTYTFMLAFTDVSVASVTQPTAASFNILVKCLPSSIDCQGSGQSDFPYFILDTNTLNLPACIITPSTCVNTTAATLTSVGATAPPSGFAALIQNADSSFTITLTSSDPLITGQTYQLQLVFSDSNGASVSQPALPRFYVHVKCTKTVNCFGSTLVDQIYFITDTTMLTVPACVITPSICPSTTVATFTSSGANTPPGDFASLTKNTNNSFSIKISSSDPLLTGLNYSFSLAFTDISVASVTQSSTPTVNMQVKCTRSVDCSGLSSNSLTYFITETTTVNIPCIKTPSICPSTTIGTLTSAGATTPPALFQVLSQNQDNSFTLTFTSINPLLTGQSYQYTLAFTDPSVVSVSQPATVNVLVKCTKSVDCSTSILADFTYFITDLTVRTIPACIITPSICANTSAVSITSTGATTPPAAPQFVGQIKNADNSFTVTLTASDPLITDQSYQFTLAFTDTSVASVIQPSTPTVNILVKCAKSVDCSSSGQSDLTLLQTATFSIDNTSALPACVIVPSICSSTSSLTLSSIGTTPSPTGFAVATKNPNNSFTLKFQSIDHLLNGKTYQFMLAFTDTAVAVVSQPLSPTFTVKVKCTSSIDCSAELKNFVYFLAEETMLTLVACKNNPAYCPDTTQVIFSQVTPLLNFVTPSPTDKYTFRIFSNDSQLIDKKYQQKLEFQNPTTVVVPTINPFPEITVKCKVKEVTHKNKSQASFNYQIGKPAYQFQFLEFEQTPACLFQWTYQLTLVKIETLTQVVNFAELIKNNPANEGSMPVGLGRLSDKTVYIETGEASFLNKIYVAFVSGTLATNLDYQLPLKQNFELARFKIVAADYSIANSAPIVSNFVREIKIFANESKEVAIAELSDFENSQALTITNLKAECAANDSNWINFSGSTNSKITLVMRVPSNVVDDNCIFVFTVNDNDLKAPISLTKEVKITVKAQVFEGVKPVVDLTPITIEVPVIKESDVSKAGIISLTFDQKLVFPERFYELTSQNEGPSYFNVTLEVNKVNLAANGYEAPNKRRLEDSDPYRFTWQVLKTQDVYEMKFAFKFNNPQIISKFEKDKIIVGILKPKEFSAFADIRVNLGEDITREFLLPQQMQSESEAQTIASTTTSVATVFKVAFATTSVGSIALSVLFVYLMGLINGLQIQALACLFRIRMPFNALQIMTMILNLAAFDFFQTDKILNGIFHFKETPSFSQIFEDAGFNGSNFIKGIGPMFLMMVLYAFFLAIRAIVLRNCKVQRKYKHQVMNSFVGKIMTVFREHKLEATCIGFILEGNIDITIWAFVCAIYVKNNGIGMPRFSDVFSNIFSFLSIVPLFLAPLYLVYRALQFNKYIQKEKIKAEEAKRTKVQDGKTKMKEGKVEQREEAKVENVLSINLKLDLEDKVLGQIEETESKNQEESKETVTEIFEGFKLNLPSLLFYLFFILRRQLMVTILVFMPTKGLIQCGIHILSSFCILIYAITYRPYENDVLTFQQICNETFTLLSAYHMLLFTDFVSDDETTITGKNLKHQLGWSFLAIIGTNLLINLAIIAREVLLKIIKHFRDKKIKKMTLQLDETRALEIKKEQEAQNKREVDQKVKNNRKAIRKAARKARNLAKIAAKRDQQRINRQQKQKAVLIPTENGVAQERQPVEEVKQAQIESISSLESSSESSDEVKPVRKGFLQRILDEREAKKAARIQTQQTPPPNSLVRDFTLTPRWPQTQQPQSQSMAQSQNQQIMNMPVNVSIRECVYPDTNQNSRTIVEDNIEEDLEKQITWPVPIPNPCYPAKQQDFNIKSGKQLSLSETQLIQQMKPSHVKNLMNYQPQQNQPVLIQPAMFKPADQQRVIDQPVLNQTEIQQPVKYNSAQQFLDQIRAKEEEEKLLIYSNTIYEDAKPGSWQERENVYWLAKNVSIQIIEKHLGNDMADKCYTRKMLQPL